MEFVAHLLIPPLVLAGFAEVVKCSVMERHFDPQKLAQSEDWEGNNIAFQCPVCDKVYLVSEQIHRGVRRCPGCGRSEGHVKGGRKSGGTASIQW